MDQTMMHVSHPTLAQHARPAVCRLQCATVNPITRAYGFRYLTNRLSTKQITSHPARRQHFENDCKGPCRRERGPVLMARTRYRHQAPAVASARTIRSPSLHKADNGVARQPSGVSRNRVYIAVCPLCCSSRALGNWSEESALELFENLGQSGFYRLTQTLLQLLWKGPNASH